MELVVYKTNGESAGRSVVLNEDIFGIEPNEHVMYLDVKQYLADRRQGTHKSKQRSEIAGSTRKLIRQKGNGGARRGDIKSPLLRGGGRVFGPQPRDYSFKLNKKVKQLARKSALSAKMKDNQITVIEDFTFEAPKTKEMVALLKNFMAENSKSLFVFPQPNGTVILSARNIQGVRIDIAQNINTHDILDAKKIFILESAIKPIEEILG